MALRRDDTIDTSYIEKEIKHVNSLLSDLSAQQNMAAKRNQEQTLSNLRATLDLEITNINKANEARLRSESNIIALKKRNLETAINIELEGIQRVKKAKLEAEGKIKDLREQNERMLTNIQTQRELMSKANWNQYAKQLKDAEKLQKQFDQNQKVMELAAKSGVDINSKQGQRLQKEAAADQRAADKKASVQETIEGLTSKNFRTKVRTFTGMINGTRVNDEGEAHSLSKDLADRKAIKESFKADRADILNSSQASLQGTTVKDVEKAQKAAQKLMFNQTRLATLQNTTVDQYNKDGSKKSAAQIKKEQDALNKKTAKAAADTTKSYDALENILKATGLSDVKDEIIASSEKEIEANIENSEELAYDLEQSISKTTGVLSELAKSLEGTMDTIASYKSAVDTRLYGSQQNDQLFDSYWSQISYDLSALMISPLVKEEDVMNNVLTVIDKGIARDVEQFAMLETIKDKIATTFDTFDGTMLRLMKIQDDNTTAARLGMEASLNELLNEMYETTEYLSDLASSVRSSLEEAEALMDSTDAVELEYQVQKWLGSLYSVGMSSSGVSSIATALGQLASGDISGITSGGASNLLIMAANEAGLSLSDILADGLDSSSTNQLLQAMVEYMAELAEGSSDSLVVQQQLAEVYGLTASDLKAATNLTGEYLGKTGYVSALASYTNSYNSMISNLASMANSMYNRLSLGEMMNNVWSNVQYSTASGMASNPITYMTMKIADVLDSLANGVEIPYISVLGSGVDPNTSVSDILRTGSLVRGFTQSLISLLSNLGSGAGLTGTSLLNMVGINTSSVSRGSSTSTSKTASIYNGSVDDITDSATQSATDESESTLVEAQEESTEVTNTTINNNIVNIYELLKDVVDGTSSLSVKLADQPITVTTASTGMSTWN